MFKLIQIKPQVDWILNTIIFIACIFSLVEKNNLNVYFWVLPLALFVKVIWSIIVRLPAAEAIKYPARLAVFGIFFGLVMLGATLVSNGEVRASFMIVGWALFSASVVTLTVLSIKYSLESDPSSPSDYFAEASIAILLWMMSDFFEKYHHPLLSGIFLYAAILTTLFSVAYFAHIKRVEVIEKLGIWLIFAASTIVLVLMLFRDSQTPSSNTSQQVKSTGVNPVDQKINVNK